MSEQKKYRKGYLQGSFDLFHIGHLNMINRSKEQCDYLVVGVVSDEIQIEKKGAPPFIPYEERAAIVAAIKGVDEVVKVDSAIFDKIASVKLLHYDAAFMGSDHTAYAATLNPKLAPYGAEAVVFPYTQSTNSTKLRALIEQNISK